MSETIQARIAQARQQVEDWRQTKADLPRVTEELSQRTHHLNRVEACLVEIEEQLRALESFTLTGLFESLLGNKQGKLDRCRAELADLEKQFEEALASVEPLQEQVRLIEEQITRLGGAEEALRAVCEEKAESLMAGDGDSPRELRQLTTDLEAAKKLLRGIQKALETGRQLLKHLESLDRAVRNAKGNKRMCGGLRGAVGGLIKNAVASMGPKSAIGYVSDALQRFHRELGELPLADHPDDTDLIRIRGELEVFQARLSTELSGIAGWEQIATLPIQQDVQVAQSHLKSMLTIAESHVQGLEQQRTRIIEAG